MDKTKKGATGTSGRAAKIEQASAHSKDAITQQWANIQMVQNILLIWLDNNIDENSTDCLNTITQLKRTVNIINRFTDDDQCIQFLQRIDNEKVCMVISGSLGQQIVPRVHNMPQVDSIFIFCDNKECHEKWTKKWPKIKGVFIDISPICEALKQTAQQCEQSAISISFMATSGDASKKNLNQLDPSFMYTQIFKEILLSIQFEQTHIEEFIHYCRDVLFANNPTELKNVDKFQRTYRNETPIWWYTYECFLYPMLNRALRLTDVDIMIKIGFFIGDLHRHIEQLHKEQFNGPHSGNSFTVYRGQGMSKVDFEKMSKTKGGLMAFNNFLSTSKDHNVSLNFAHVALPNLDMLGILFVMKIDPSKSTTPFASITDVSYFKDREDEVLFAMHSVFRIGDITPMDGNDRLFQVDLTMTNDNDKDLRALTARIQEETFPEEEGWYRLGKLLLTMGQSKKTQQVYEVLLEEATEENKTGSIHRLIGNAKLAQGEYHEAITSYEKSLEIYKKTLPPNHPDFAKSYNQIGLGYDSMGEYLKALSYYEKALEIDQKSLSPNHPDMALSYMSIGNVYNTMGEYSKALSSHEKALEIRQQSLPPNHPGLAASCNNIGNVYDSMGEYSKALSYYEKALEIDQKSLPPNHPDLALSYMSIGNVYNSMGEYSKALSSHKKALEIRQQSLPSNHPDLAYSYNNIGDVYDSMGEYSKALSSHKKSLEIKQQSLPPNHPDLAASYNNIGNVYGNMGEYLKELSFHEKALEIRQQSLPPSHPDLGGSYNNIGLVYKNMDEYSKALSFYEKALEIQQQSLSPNHPDLASSYMNIGNVYADMSKYSKALLYYEKSLQIKQQSLPANHPDLAESYNNIGTVYEDMDNYSTARLFYERTVEMGQYSLPSNHPNLQRWRNNLDRVNKKL